MIQRKTPIKRSGRLKPVNRARKARLFAEDFGSKEYVEHIHSLPCAACLVTGWTEAAHVRSRGAGGKVDDLVPLCGNRLGIEGCHSRFDRHERETRQLEPMLRTLAKRIRKLFLETHRRDDDAA